MALEGPAERRDEVQVAMGNGNGVAPLQVSRLAGRPAAATAPYADPRLRLNPNAEHKPQDYSDVRGEYAPAVYSALERHLPPSLLDADRGVKLHFMRDVLARYWPQGERNKVRFSIPPRYLLISMVIRLIHARWLFFVVIFTSSIFYFAGIVGGSQVTFFSGKPFKVSLFLFCLLMVISLVSVF
jgi:hypothetical protein